MLVGPSPVHAIVVARGIKRCVISAALHPGWWALICWCAWRFFTAPAVVAGIASPPTSPSDISCIQTGALPRSCILESRGGPPLPFVAVAEPVAGPAKVLEWVGLGFFYAGVALLVSAAILGLFSLLTMPTHRVGGSGQLHAVGRGAARPTLASRATHRGAYQRIKPPRGGFKADWSAAKRDATNLDKRLARVGRWRLRRWHRRINNERSRGVAEGSLSKARFYDRFLFRRIDPPKTERGKQKAEKRNTKKATKKSERKAARKSGPAPYDSDDMPPPPPRSPSPAPGPRLDPDDGPPVAPPSRSEPMVAPNGDLFDNEGW